MKHSRKKIKRRSNERAAQKEKWAYIFPCWDDYSDNPARRAFRAGGPARKRASTVLDQSDEEWRDIEPYDGQDWFFLYDEYWAEVWFNWRYVDENEPYCEYYDPRGGESFLRDPAYAC